MTTSKGLTIVVALFAGGTSLPLIGFLAATQIMLARPRRRKVHRPRNASGRQISLPVRLVKPVHLGLWRPLTLQTRGALRPIQ
jgi:hypothetical protein